MQPGSLLRLRAGIVPEGEWNKLIWNARLFMGIYVLMIIWCIAIESILPIVFLFLPRFFGAWGLESSRDNAGIPDWPKVSGTTG